MRKHHDIHVSADRGPRRWKVTRGGKTLSFHRTQASALKTALRQAKRRRVDVVTHGRNGRIRSKDSYHNETCIRDTEH
jgi:hypothetical protein